MKTGWLQPVSATRAAHPDPPEQTADGIAIVGMSCRFPGAPNVEAFWENLKEGVESVTFFTDEELAAAGVERELLKNPNYVKARSVLEGADLFDAEFFGYHPHEAARMDPQHRVFLETAWEALEDAGCDPERYEGAIGVFAGLYLDTYLLANLCSSREFIEDLLSFKKAGAFQTFLGNDKDYLTTRTAYKLNLRGPAVTVQTACSTSLVSVCMACQSLLTCESDMALAGGVTITFPEKKGYLHQEGGMLSPDGHCRAFDARARGTVFGSGAGVVALKRLRDALADGDRIYAVIKGAALNNDGAAKVSYTAPGVEGQSEVILRAQALAGVPPNTIGYVEAHGTGTPLGDPIEIAALTQAFRVGTDRRQFCAVGSVKTNIGHLDVASGVAGLIKTSLALYHGRIPASLHFESPNPDIDFANSPFYVNTRLTDWKREGTPRRAAVSSFGVGGTNAHAVLEEAPPAEAAGQSRPWQLLLLSAGSEPALERATARLAEHLRRTPDVNLADAAFTLQTGRRQFNRRRALVCRDAGEAIRLLEHPDARRVWSGLREKHNPPVVFMFPGQGAQTVNMGRDLCRSEPVFRGELDRCAGLLMRHLGMDLREVLYPPEYRAAAAAEELRQTRLAQPALFSVEYALARLWMSWGVKPAAMIGHSIGEYVAGCLAGVFSLEDALGLVAERARLVQEQPGGAMLAVCLSEEAVRALIDDTLAIAAVNSPDRCVISGPNEAVGEFEQRLQEKGIPAVRLKTSHAFHSAMMDPVLAPFTAALKKVSLKPPEIPCLSNVTARWITPEEATDPGYWAAHVRQTVRFSDGVAEILKEPANVLLEVGPGQTLCGLAGQQSSKHPGRVIVPSLSQGNESGGSAILSALGRLWLAGVEPDWAGFYAEERRRRAGLPGYPFDRKRHRVDAPAQNWSGVETPPADTPSPRRDEWTVPTVDAAPETSKQVTPQSTNTHAKSNRREWILSTLKSMFHELSGMELAGGDLSIPFLELGFDSLFLTQARQAFQSKFGVRVTYRQLSEELRTVETLAEYLDSRLPPEVPVCNESNLAPAETSASSPLPTHPEGAPFFRNEPPVPPVVEPTADAPAPARPAAGKLDGSLQRTMRQQLEAMSRLIEDQLAVLGVRNDSTRGGSELDGGAESPESRASAPAASSATEPADRNGHCEPRAGNGAPAVVEPASDGGGIEAAPMGPFRPPVRKGGDELTADQRAWLARFIEAYNARTAGSKRIAREIRRGVADPRALANYRREWKELVYQIVAERSAGSRLWDVDGNEYLDVTMGFGVNLFGHAPPFVMEAVAGQLQKGVHIGPQSPLTGEVAALVSGFTGMERVTFTNTGSEAVMAALRVARTVTGRSRIVYFTHDYHGLFDEVLQRAIRVHGKPRSVPVAPGIPMKAGEEVLVLDYGDSRSLEIIREQASELAAVLVEPVQSRHPELQPREFLRELRRITEQSGTVLIFDEVITGFRMHPGGAQAMFGVRADLAAYGKVVGGGLPIGVLAGRAGCMDALDGGFWQFGDDSGPEADVTFFAGTFVRHPLALAAAKASLLHLREQGPGLQEALNLKTGRLAETLNGFFESEGLPIQARHFGSLFRFQFPPALPQAALLIYQLLHRGVYMRETHQNCFLSTAHTEADCAEIIERMKAGALELRDAGFFRAEGAGDGRGVSGTAGVSVPQPGVIAGADEDAGGEGRREPAVRVPDRFPLTDAQKEIWLACQLGAEASCAYNESFTLEMRGGLRIEELREAMREVGERHEALRTTMEPDGSHQRVAPELTLELSLTDWSGLEAGERREKVEAIAAVEAGQPFDLIQGPLARARLFKLEEQRHLLVFTAHHIICDGWSSNVILDELGRLYSARVEGTDPRLEPPMAFSEFAALQQQARESREGRESEDSWLKQFAEPPPVLDLPVDKPRPAKRTGRGGTERLVIESTLCQALRRTGAAGGGTLFAVMLAAYNLWLQRLSGQDEMVIGIFTSGQAMAGREDLVGHCVNMLPLRISVPERGAFPEFVRQTSRVINEARDHEPPTYGRLVERLRIARDRGRAPLVSALFNLERKGDEGLKFAGLETALDQNPHGTVNFDLFLNARQTDGSLILDLEYNADLWEAGTIRRWLGHFQTLLRGIVEEPGRSVVELPVMTDAERRRLLVEWNDTAMDYPRGACLHELFEAQADATPDDIALVAGDEWVSYRELNLRANRLSNHLRSIGVGRESLAGICLERSADMVVALLGVLKAGAAFVPLDPAHPSERLSFIFQDAGLRAVITQSSLAGLISEAGASDGAGEAGDRPWLINLDAASGEILRESGGNPVAPPRPDNLAYVIHTSGSTGRPKGVAIEHRSAVSFVHWARRVYSPEELDGVLAATSICFDLSIFELFVPLSLGGRIILAKDALALPGLAAARQVRLINTVPSAIAGLLRVDGIPDTVETINLAGEPLSRDLVRQLYDLPHVRRVYDLYGPTESTTYSTFALREPDGRATIGRPIANTRVHILDRLLRPVPAGVPGELFIGGEGLARGYLNRPEMTAERFIPDPFSGGTGERLYRTGDAARYRPEGDIEYLGRLDDQIKLRGFRIEPGEIEVALRSHPEVRETVVMAREDTADDPRLVAYVVPREAAGGGDSLKEEEQQWLGDLTAQFETGYRTAIDEAASHPHEPAHDPTLNIHAWSGLENTGKEVADWIEQIAGRVLELKPLHACANNPLQAGRADSLVPGLRAHLRARLPDYMVPSAFVLLDRLPLTPNGKIDRTKLPAPDTSHEGAGGDPLPPRTPGEEAICRMCCELLGLQQVGVTDNFFDLGGHSLLATQLVAKVRAAFQVDLPMQCVFESPTVAGLAAAVEEALIEEIDNLGEEDIHRAADWVSSGRE